MIVFLDNTDELQYLIEALNHESQENGTESKAEQKQDHTQLISVDRKMKEQVTQQFYMQTYLRSLM